MALARAYLGGVHLFPSAVAFERANRLAIGVLEVEPSHPEALVVRGEVALRAHWDLAKAQQDLELAEKLNPGLARARHLIALVLASEGRVVEAVEAILEARRMDPENLYVTSDVGYFHMLARQPEPALEAARLVVEMEPRFRLMHAIILWSMDELGDRDGGLKEANRYLAVHGAEPAPSLEAFFAAERRFLVALRESGSAPVMDLAESAIRAGEPDEALDVLLRGCETKTDPALLFAASDPRLDALRSAPRFSAVLECVAG